MFQVEQVTSLAAVFVNSARASGWRCYSLQRLDLGGFGEVVEMHGAPDREGRRHPQSLRPPMTAISQSIGLALWLFRHARGVLIELLRTTVAASRKLAARRRRQRCCDPREWQ